MKPGVLNIVDSSVSIGRITIEFEITNNLDIIQVVPRDPDFVISEIE